MFEPLKITAYLQCGAIGDHTFPIDQILYYLAMRETYGVEAVTAPLDVLGITPVVLPLEMRIEGPHWFYAASFAQWPQTIAQNTEYWHKRFDLSLVHLLSTKERQRTVRVDAMRYKSYRMPVFARHALMVIWYVVGDRAEITRLLSGCFWIGKKTSQGYGAVRSWTVDPFPHDWSVSGSDGQQMRNLPVKPGERGMLMGIRPSYWDRHNQTFCRWEPLAWSH